MASEHPGATTRSRAGLSRDRILDAAAVLAAEDDGVVSMRRLAELLEVTPMAIYRWFANKDELLDALTARALEPAPAGEVGDGPWIERALQFAVRIRRNLLVHLPLLKIEGASRRLSTNVFRDADEGLRLVLELGYEGQAAVDAYRVVFWSIVDFCLVIDATGAMPGAVGPERIAEHFAPLGDEGLASLPTLAAHVQYFGAVDVDAFFELTMRTVLAGLGEQAPDR